LIHPPLKGIIIFYCGPATDEERVMQIGQKLLEQIPYRNHYGAMFYKSDALTTQGTRATGMASSILQIRNYILLLILHSLQAIVATMISEFL
jgi:hypothetical protein